MVNSINSNYRELPQQHRQDAPPIPTEDLQNDPHEMKISMMTAVCESSGYSTMLGWMQRAEMDIPIPKEFQDEPDKTHKNEKQ